MMIAKALERIVLPAIVITIVLGGSNTTARGDDPTADTVPVLQYDPPVTFMRSALYPPEDYLSRQFNASFQIYQFEPFTGNIAELFQRTLLRDRIDPRHREERVSGTPQFGRGAIAGAQEVFHATFFENNVGIPKPHFRMVIVAGHAAAIVDVSANNPSLWQRLTPDVSAMIHTMRVVTTAAPPSLIAGPEAAVGSIIAGLYRGTKQKFMTGLTFQSSYYTSALHFYLFSSTGRVYRAYDQIRAPGGDVSRFDFDSAQRANPVNSGRYAVKGDKLYIQMGQAPIIVTALPADNTLTIDSVTYVRQ